MMDEQERIEKLPYTLPKKLTQILDGFKWAVQEKNTSVVGISDGRSGMGKTTISNQIAKYCDEGYDLNKIHYDPEEFLHGSPGKIGLAQAKEGDFLLFDEAMLISSRAALSQINRMVIQAMSMIRSKKIYVWFCVNSIFDLDRNLALSRADLVLHVYGKSLTDRGQFLAFFKGSDGFDRIKALYLNGKKFYSYSTPKCNFNARFPKHFVVDEEAYEVQKQKGIFNFLNKIDSFKGPTKAEIGRNKLMLHCKRELGMKQVDMAEITGLTVVRISQIMRSLRENPENL